jgi:adenylyltransferase/sulfurtransferase
LAKGIRPGRDRLAKASIAVVGIEEHTLFALAQLADAGIGSVKLIDHRLVTHEDVAQAFFYFQGEEGKPRISAARDVIESEDIGCLVQVFQEKFDAHNAEQLLGGVDLVIDGLTNWQDKLLASDVCMQLKTPLVHAGLSGLDVQVFCMIPSRSACLRCVFAKLGMEDFATTSKASGRAQLGSLTAIAGSLQALECIKLLGDIGTISPTRLMKIDGLRGDFLDIRDLTPRSDCPDCGRR